MLNYLSIVCMCARVFARLIYRDPGYLGLLMSMYGRTLNSPVRAQLMRATCCLARLNDNMVTLTLDPFARQAWIGRIRGKALGQCSAERLRLLGSDGRGTVE